MSSISLTGFKRRRTISSVEEVFEDINSDLVPDQNLTRSLGSLTFRWLAAFIQTLNVGNIIPFITDTYDLGSTDYQFHDAWFAGNVNVSTLNQNNVPTSGGDLVATNSTQTLNNKRLDAPTISGANILPDVSETTDIGSNLFYFARLFLSNLIQTTSSVMMRYTNNGENFHIGVSPSTLDASGGWAVVSTKTVNFPTDFNTASDTVVLLNHSQTLSNKTINVFITNSRNITCVDPGAASNLYFYRAPSDIAVVFDQGPIATPADANQTWRFERLGGTNEVKITVPRQVLAAGGTNPFRTTAIAAAWRPANNQRKSIPVIDNSSSDGSNCFIGSMEIQTSGVIYIGTSTNIAAYTNANNLGWGPFTFTYQLGNTLTVV